MLTLLGSIAWPSIVQHPRIIPTPPSSIIILLHHISSRHVITRSPTLPLLRPTATFLLPTMDDIPFSFPFFYSYYYSLSMHPPPPLTSINPRLWAMNSLRPFFRLLFASRVCHCLFFFPFGFGISITVTLQANIINTKRYIQVTTTGL